MLKQSHGDELRRRFDEAVRVTSNHERAVAYGQVCARMMELAIEGKSLDKVIAAGHRAGNQEIVTAIKSALSMADEDVSKVTAHFGLACDLRHGVPSVIHNITTAPSFREAIRRNIYAGGDTCGRSILLGAVLGAAYGIDGEQGIPEAWIDKLSFKDELISTLSRALN